VENREQAALWNDAVGEAWVRNSDHYDETLAPFGLAAMERLDLRPGHAVLDVGCGTGAATLELAARNGGAPVVGVDLSAPMVERARRRVPEADRSRVRFEVVDVQADPLPGGPYDRVFTRFGVMFFGDPVRAFRRVAEATASGGRLAFVCFKDPAFNPLITVPVLAAAAHLALPPMPAPDAPGPFSMADPAATTQVLEQAGFADVAMHDGPAEAAMRGDDLHEVARRLLEQNPVTGPALRSADDATREAAVVAAAEAIAPHASDGVVRMGTGTWVVSARRP
jgi:ubiquinone/menaquinone biosynthesis C-methylase UbiE